MDAERAAEGDHVLEDPVPLAPAGRDLPVLAERGEVVDEQQDPRLALVAGKLRGSRRCSWRGRRRTSRPTVEFGAQHPEQPHDALVVLAGDDGADARQLLEQRAAPPRRSRARRRRPPTRSASAAAAASVRRPPTCPSRRCRTRPCDRRRRAGRPRPPAPAAPGCRPRRAAAGRRCAGADRAGRSPPGARRARAARGGDARAARGLGHHVDHPLLVGRAEILALLRRRRRRPAPTTSPPTPNGMSAMSTRGASGAPVDHPPA